MISKAKIGATTGNINAVLVDYRDMLAPDARAKLEAARKVLTDLMRKI